MLDSETSEDKCSGQGKGDPDKTGLAVEPGDGRREGGDDKHYNQRQSDVDPERVETGRA